MTAAADRDATVRVDGLDEIQPEFESVRAAVELALRQEQRVTEQIQQLAHTARAAGDYLGEQFVQW